MPNPLSIATVSVPSSPLPDKLQAIHNAGFAGIELGFPDLLSFAFRLSGRKVHEDDYDTLCYAATQVKKLCGELGLQIVMLQPFANFEGWEKGSKEREDAFERARGWIRIMESLGAGMLQVCFVLFSGFLVLFQSCLSSPLFLSKTKNTTN